MGAAGVRHVGRLEVARRLQPGRDAERGGRHRGDRSEPREGHAVLGPAAVGERRAVLLDFVLGDAQYARGEADRLRAEVARGERDRVAAHHRGAARERADALLDARGVAGDHGDVLGRHAELVRRHLGERRLEPLPLRADAGEDGDAPGRVHARDVAPSNGPTPVSST